MRPWPEARTRPSTAHAARVSLWVSNPVSPPRPERFRGRVWQSHYWPVTGGLRWVSKQRDWHTRSPIPSERNDLVTDQPVPAWSLDGLSAEPEPPLQPTHRLVR